MIIIAKIPNALVEAISKHFAVKDSLNLIAKAVDKYESIVR